MVAYVVSPQRVKLRLPTKQELLAMLDRPAVAITAMICATLAFVAALAGIVFIVHDGHDASVIGLFVGGPVVALLAVVARRLKSVHDAVTNQESQP